MIKTLENFQLNETEFRKYKDKKSNLAFFHFKKNSLLNDKLKVSGSKNSKSKTLLITELAILPVVLLLVFSSGINLIGFDNPVQANLIPLKDKYFIENLKGDSINTWKSWNLVPGTPLIVNIINAKHISNDQIEIIEQAIISEDIVNFEDSFSKKKFKYFKGWTGALGSVNQNTKYQLPSKFNLINSNTGGGDIIITLSNLRDNDGYTGYTKSIIENNEILKSFITIYDISNLKDEQLATIVRHEFGHALGLGDSTAPEDLMAPTIDMTYPYISQCNVDAIIDLYKGIQGRTVCEN